jgi:very-short-patch-repair endonuclease
MRSTTRATVARARSLRRTLSKPEACLWQVLRTRPAGLKFRRQHPLGPYVLDFYCPTARLGIEVDGCSHEMGDNVARDRTRDHWLEQHEVRVLRVTAADVLSDLDAVVRQIVAACGADCPSTVVPTVPLPTASPQGGQ